MAPRAESNGTESDRRGSSSKTWKKFPVKFNFYVTTLSLFFLLLVVKVIFSGIFLHSSPLNIAAADVVMAQEAPAEEELNLEDLEMKLRKREKELDAREARLNKMEEQLKPLKEEIDESMAQLTDLQSTLTAKAADLAKREKTLKDSKTDHLVKLYSSMEPKEAAKRLAKVDIDLATRILGNMKGKTAGEVMAMMNEDTSVIITERLSSSN